MYLGKSLTYCSFCRGYVYCNLSIDNKSIIKSIGFSVSNNCPNFQKSAVKVVKISIEKSIYDVKNELIKSKKITPCTQPIWDSIRFSFDKIKSQ
jgi:hypothetical protein